MFDDDMKSARLLIVDDQQANVTLLERILRSQGFVNLVSTTDSRQVESMYRQAPADLVLLDLVMPHLDGFQVMTLLQRLSGDEFLPVIVLTANADQETKLRALSAGAMEFLGKPFDLVEVQLRIRNMLQTRLMHMALRSQNAQLEDRVKDRTQELEQTRLEVIRRLGRAAEYRDNETGLHTIRMSNYSALLARVVGLSGSDCELILNASPMHDLGKIGIPDGILLKPGKLDAAEWITMKTHPLIGAEILSGHETELMRVAHAIALNHHEKWDGSGYPAGLKGEEIPLVARIVAVADVFDALTTARPYKSAWSVEDALEYIREQSGHHFEPRLVDAFLSLLPEVLDIRRRYAEPE
ncbi:two-component system response regulator [Denitratisoma sp. DHT3]|uniref:HD domain-containing phosphohydrolase n=1 Tax=Denitratisoma sp. DHT3 TaxID=1981880 RepID=UPI001198C0E6|nr:HD domain-containing phosphohydrolase [Denitratisoma sp. DHT3]QDX80108.1 two-component system response regulator [Denitratisoma sp. DHT3]